MDVAWLVSRLDEAVPGFRAWLQSDGALFETDNAHGVFAACSEFVREQPAASNSWPELAQLVNGIVDADDEELADAACTCFLENLAHREHPLSAVLQGGALSYWLRWCERDRRRSGSDGEPANPVAAVHINAPLYRDAAALRPRSRHARLAFWCFGICVALLVASGVLLFAPGLRLIETPFVMFIPLVAFVLLAFSGVGTLAGVFALLHREQRKVAMASLVCNLTLFLPIGTLVCIAYANIP